MEPRKIDRKMIGKSIKEARKKAGYKSARAFAEAAGLQVTAYTEYEQGRVSMSYETALQIADVLGVALDALVGRTPPASHDNELCGAQNSMEAELLDCYRSSTPDRQGRILDTARDAAAVSFPRPEAE